MGYAGLFPCRVFIYLNIYIAPC